MADGGPTVYGFTADALNLHGSVASQSLNTAGAPVCVTITLTDGLVLARSVFEHTINYRSAMIYGQPRLVTDPAELWVPKTCATWPDTPLTAGCSAPRPGRARPVLACQSVG